MMEYCGVKLFLFYTFHVCLVLSYVQDGQSDRINTTYQDVYNPNVTANAKQIRWAETAFEYVTNLDCRSVFFTTQRDCQHLVKLKRSDVNVYLADPTPEGRLLSVLPDGSLSRGGSHDGVLVLDPSPQANFGHLVIVFFIDMKVPASVCESQGGISVGADECMTLALKNRCKNILERRRRERDATDLRRMRKFARRCEINFLPLVHLENDAAEGRTQTLICRDNVPSFGSCPVMRPFNESTELICNPIRDNSRRCETTHDTVQTKCRVFEICDQALVISGGWNREASLVRHEENAVGFFRLLRKNGFQRNNIKMFFANGMSGGIPDEEGGEPHKVYPAAMKLAMRYHVKKMCESPHCVDSLVMYLNGPTRTDGSMLLWDVNHNGLIDESEIYTVEELMDDTANCEARNVQIIADQSFSGELARAVRKSRHHRNVVVFASGGLHEYSYGNVYTQHWLNFNHTHACSHDAHQDAANKMRVSTPDIGEPDGLNHVTLFGAPCDVRPPFTHDELRRNYLGCQNVPTALWFVKMSQSRSAQFSPFGRTFMPRFKTRSHEQR